MKKRGNISLSFFLVCLFLFSIQVQAKTELKSLNVGEAEASDAVIKTEAYCIPLVKVNGLHYILDDDLGMLGLQLTEKEEAFYMNERTPVEVEQKQLIDEYGQKLSSCSKLVYWGLMQSHLLVLNGHYYVPLSFLQNKWQGENEGRAWHFTSPRHNAYLVNLEGKGNTITNTGDYWLNLEVDHYYWQDGSFQMKKEAVLLGPNESHTWQLDEKEIYVGTQYHKVNGLTPSLEEQSDIMSQRAFYDAYRRAERLRILETYFPISSIEAQMKYGVGKLKEKEIVSLMRSENRAYYWVKNEEGEKFQVPFGSIQIIGERWARLPIASEELIEEFVSLSGIESETDYLVWTDINRQKTYVLQRQEGGWHHLKTFVCSSGKNNNPTPTGIYKVQYAIPYFGLSKNFRCKNALVFYRDYMYHSILFDKTGQYIKSGQYELGSKASHGCIRLSEKDSRWLYEHVPVKTTVWIR